MKGQCLGSFAVLVAKILEWLHYGVVLYIIFNNLPEVKGDKDVLILICCHLQGFKRE